MERNIEFELMVYSLLPSHWLKVITWHGYWPLIGWKLSHDLDTGLWLAESDHITWILASDWQRVIPLPGYCPLIGGEWSCDLDTALWLAECMDPLLALLPGANCWFSKRLLIWFLQSICKLDENTWARRRSQNSTVAKFQQITTSPDFNNVERIQ